MKKALLAAGLFLFITHAASAGPVPDTGQVTCYNMSGEIDCPDPGAVFFGQDAQHATAQRSFTKLDSQGRALADSVTQWSMVRDNLTGLVWEIKNNQDGTADPANPHDADNTYSWYDDNASHNGGNAGQQGEGTDTSDFTAALKSSFFGGFDDWRLPTARELVWVLDRGAAGPPFIDVKYFPGMADEYWTSTTDPIDAAQCATVTLTIGMMNYPPKNNACYAMAVRGARAPQQFQDNGDGTVSDLATGLMWQKGSVQGISWKDSLAYCDALDLGGHTDWRLPNVNELISLADYERYSPSIDTNFFTNTSYHYWSSTSYPADPSRAYHVCFLRGRTEVYRKADAGLASHLRAVRGGCDTCSSTTTTARPCLAEKLYGQESPEAVLLRRYRDRVLAQSACGRALIQCYYRFSGLAEKYLSEKLLRAASDKLIADFINPE